MQIAFASYLPATVQIANLGVQSIRASDVMHIQGAVQIFPAGIAKATLRKKIKLERSRCGADGIRTHLPD